MSKKVTDEMVNRFLCWKLPQDFGPDCYIAFDREKASQGSWPTGTNLLHAGQAREMLEHVAAPLTTENSELQAALGHTKTLLGSAEMQVNELRAKVAVLQALQPEMP